ncbi:MAG: DUF3501 family protein [Candidatus Eisenbacteria bacterium]|uniref:DUF3501 family protein n=1 Tax=Eiseniibacteriota bacterium TaxID=2212470 RepID=A0A7Y2H3C8_UNCEI|nr:DUF3501 family protein [Candidatus Eisenbacteria bacterium]
MSRLVERDEILDFETYGEVRDKVRQEIFKVKEPRRVHVGEDLTFLFENKATMRYQIQEMVRVERMVKEASILHELETYNQLLGSPGELPCSLLIEIGDPEERAQKLTQWLDLPKHLYVKMSDGAKVYALYDEGQVGEDRLSAVQYLRFPTEGKAPVAVGTDHPALRLETALNSDQQAALAKDLNS